MKTVMKHKDAMRNILCVCITFLLLSLFLISVQATWAFRQGSVSIIGLTEPGTDVLVRLSELNAEKNAVTVTFDEVRTTGITRLKKADTGTLPQPLPFRPRTQPAYYSIETTAEYRDRVKLCVSYRGERYPERRSTEAAAYGKWIVERTGNRPGL